MNPPREPQEDFSDFTLEGIRPASRKVSADDILQDLRHGLRTREFLSKYNLTLAQFEGLLKKLIRNGLLTKDEFRAWKDRRSVNSTPEKEESEQETVLPLADKLNHHVETFVIREPEKNNSWALQLFSTHRDRMKGAQFKVNLHGKKYSFIVEDMLFRGQVEMLSTAEEERTVEKSKRDQAMDFIARHGWAAYLENRAVSANLEETTFQNRKIARLVLLQCRNNTFLAALHSPAPAINLYVGSSLEKICGRLAKSVDTSILDL